MEEEMKINYNQEMQKTIEGLDGKRPGLLLHSCCGPCSTSVIERLKPYFELTVYFYNPNIYPEAEYSRRQEEQKRYLASIGVDYLAGDYESGVYENHILGLEKEPEGGRRCHSCFELRLEKTAAKADDLKIEYFTTTLTVSTHKNSQVINRIGIDVAERHGAKFLKSDFKKNDGYKRSVNLSQELGMYRQDYCGCRYSIKERENKVKSNFDKILFDLDGTITDSKEGIIKSIRYAYDKMGLPQPEEEFLMSFLGPPLWDSFVHKVGLSEKDAERGVAFFRERFQPLGIYENKLFPGMAELLHLLSQRRDIKIYIATAKPLPSAIRVLEYFKIIRYFDDISGATFDGTITGKTQVISNLLDKFEPDFNRERTLMIGDRDHDVQGARENGIKSLGVLYGYGSPDEIREADYLVESVTDLQKFLLGGN